MCANFAEKIARKQCFAVIVALVCAFVAKTSSASAIPPLALENPMSLKLYRQLKLLSQNLMGELVNRRENRALMRTLNKVQDRIDDSAPFFCPLNGTRSTIRPQSVHKLRPGDIDVIASIGDSITAGVGLTATNMLQVYYENRDMALASGGAGTWREYLTIANILKEFNPKLFGYATRACITTQKCSLFNVAETGAKSQDTLYMAKILMKRIRSNSNVNFAKDWKLIHFSIGANDFCSGLCYEDPKTYLKRHRSDLVNTLRYLRDNIPRTFVSLLLVPNLVQIMNFTNRPFECEINNRVVCPCLIADGYASRRQEFIRFMDTWQDVQMEVSSLKEFDRDDFTVVLQPFTRDLTFPRDSEGVTDYTVLSADCFHFSQKGNTRIASELWNNMLEPVGRKDTFGTLLPKPLRCPSKANPYIFTRRNSKV